MNKKQSISLLRHLSLESVNGRQFAAAIALYAQESPFAFLNEGQTRLNQPEYSTLWEEAADALGTRFIGSPKNLDVFAERFGLCQTLSIFWNHITALLDDLLNDHSGRVIAPAHPIFRLVYNHECSVCSNKILLELNSENQPNQTVRTYRELLNLMKKHRAPRRRVL